MERSNKFFGTELHIDCEWLSMVTLFLALGSLLLALVPLAQWLRQSAKFKKAEIQNAAYSRFEFYRRLLLEINGAVIGYERDKPYMTMQVAMIRELRNYPEYSETSILVLEELKKFWSDNATSEDFLVRQTKETIKHLKRNHRS